MTITIMRGVLLTVLASSIALFSSTAASAHVVVSPRQILTSERSTFTVSVPNEHDTPVVAVRLEIPKNVTSVRPYVKQGWTVEVSKEGTGENARVTEVKWTSSGATVPVDLKDDFLISAQAADEPGVIRWNAYETYENGLEVAWNQDPSGAEDTKPYSVTKIAAEASTGESSDSSLHTGVHTSDDSRRALYVAGIGLLISFAAFFFATRKR